MNYSKGITWFDDCRIPFVDDVNINAIQNQNEKGDIYGGGKGYHKKGYQNKVYKPEGRFPANLLCSDDMLNDGSVSKSGSNSRYYDIHKWFNKLLDEL